MAVSGRADDAKAEYDKMTSQFPAFASQVTSTQPEALAFPHRHCDRTECWSSGEFWSAKLEQLRSGFWGEHGEYALDASDPQLRV